MAERYGAVSSAHVDPIEKKPLHHFLPGAAIFSVGGWGCNFACEFCQNWTLSQQVGEGDACTPEQIVAYGRDAGSIGIAYTYNEPVVGFEFVLDCARLAKAAGLKNVLVTNGYLNPEPAAELLPWLDAANIDIKSMSDAFYRRYCRGSLQPVLDFAVQARRAGCHVEVTNLVIPGLNDAEAGFGQLAAWLAANLGKTTPLHLSAYYPRHKMRIPPTPDTALRAAHEICRRHLEYVYVGNARVDVGQDTVCPGCGATWVTRRGYAVRVVGIRNGGCVRCQRPVDLVLE